MRHAKEMHEFADKIVIESWPGCFQSYGWTVKGREQICKEHVPLVELPSEDEDLASVDLVGQGRTHLVDWWDQPLLMSDFIAPQFYGDL